MTRAPGFNCSLAALAVVVLSAAVAAPQEPATVEREAFAAVSRAVAALERTDERSTLIPAAAQVATAVGHARDAFVAADRARELVAEGYRAAHEAAQAAAVTCDNGTRARTAGSTASKDWPTRWSGISS